MKKNVYIIFFGLLLRIFLSIINSFQNTLPGAEYDAITFHNKAVDIAAGWENIDLSTGWIYSTLLGIIYRYTLSSIFLGCLVSVFAWFISAIILNRIIDILKIQDNHRTIILFLYSFWPSAAIFTAVTLRESFQLLFINLLIFAYIKLFIQNKIKYTFLVFASIICLASLHKTYAVLSFFYLLIYIFGFLIKRKKIINIFLISIILIIIANFYLKAYHEQNLANISLNKIFFYELLSTHINNMTDTRAGYRNEEVYINDNYDLIQYVASSIAYYFTQPTPLVHENLYDLLLYSENILRLILLIFVFLNLFKFMNFNYKIFILIFLVYISLELTWALGTNNWGTAIRHHVPPMGLLLLLSFFSVKKL
jgi:hypothetical protein